MLDIWVAALFSYLAFIPSGGVKTASYAVTVVREHQLCGSCIGRLHSSPVSVLCRSIMASVCWPQVLQEHSQHSHVCSKEATPLLVDADEHPLAKDHMT